MKPSERIWRERALRAAVLAGDEEAWRHWYEDSFSALYTFVLWRCGGIREHADEVVQETWLNAVKRIRTFKPEAGSFAGWLRGISANLLRNHFRRENLRKARARPLGDHQPESEWTGTDQEKRDQAEHIARVLSTLPEHYEQVLRAKYLDRRSMAEIALANGGSLKAVESLLTRARQAFREAYFQKESQP